VLDRKHSTLVTALAKGNRVTCPLHVSRSVAASAGSSPAAACMWNRCSWPSPHLMIGTSCTKPGTIITVASRRFIRQTNRSCVLPKTAVVMGHFVRDFRSEIGFCKKKTFQYESDLKMDSAKIRIAISVLRLVNGLT
jgi:hypothetical protein